MTFLLALVTLILLRLTERWIHLHLQLIGHRLAGSETAALSIYAIIFFPGVVLHELSHWLFAKLCGVRTGRISLLPSVGKTGNLHLGSVEYSAAGLDPFRESLIGAAPLMVGCTVLLLIANHLFGVPAARVALSSGDLDALLDLLRTGFRTPDFWLWYYLAFAIANAMMPSPADRRAWPALMLIIALITGLMVVLGLGDLVIEGMRGLFTLGISYLATAFAFTICINLLMIAIIALLERLPGLQRR